MTPRRESRASGQLLSRNAPYRIGAGISAFWILEDTYTYAERRNGSRLGAVRLYRVRQKLPELVAETSYSPKGDGRGDFRAQLAVDLLRAARVRDGIVVVASRVGRGKTLIRGLQELGVDFVVALRLSSTRDSGDHDDDRHLRSFFEHLANADWNESDVTAPDSAATYSLADLGKVAYAGVRGLRCIALSTGGIADFRRGLIVGVSSLSAQIPSEQIARLLGWSRWVRVLSRRQGKSEFAATEQAHVARMGESKDTALRLMTDLTARTSLKNARSQDDHVAAHGFPGLWDGFNLFGGRLEGAKRRLNVVELFAGAGGMGLGFLLAGGATKGYRVLFSGEVDPISANTLNFNHEFLRRTNSVQMEAVPEKTDAVDLRSGAAMEQVQSVVAQHRGVDIMIGGPPCQGFSSANRNSASSKNPNNKLVDTYLDYVVRLRPNVFIMENVQGILWTPHHGAADSRSVAGHVASRLSGAGYRIFPKLIDAAWFGVPQHRNRFFLMGLHSDLGYAQDDFGEWGPYPRPTHGPLAGRPYVTVRDALGDLPPIANGEFAEEMPYEATPYQTDSFLAHVRRWAPQGVVWDHVVSRHADYVIERYRKIPEGGNWSDIADMMTNYAAVERTHSNIYRRLIWDEPSITIGHYRKAMLVHPSQHRGISLREAARLQSFPDWFRFAGGEDRIAGGLSHKQQQLGNAVCPLVTKAVAEFLLEL